MRIRIEITDDEGNEIKQRIDLNKEWETFSVWTIFLLIRGLFVKSSFED